MTMRMLRLIPVFVVAPVLAQPTLADGQTVYRAGLVQSILDTAHQRWEFDGAAPQASTSKLVLSSSGLPRDRGGALSYSPDFGAATQYITIADNAALDVGDSDYMACAFMVADALPTPAFVPISKSDWGVQWEWNVGIPDSGDISGGYRTDTGASASTGTVPSAILIGYKRHYCLAFDVSELKAGISTGNSAVGFGSAASSGTVGATSTADVILGIRGDFDSTWRLDGRLSGFSIYKAADDLPFTSLSQADYNSGAGTNCDTLTDEQNDYLVGFWELGETTGNYVSCVGALVGVPSGVRPGKGIPVIGLGDSEAGIYFNGSSYYYGSFATLGYTGDQSVCVWLMPTASAAGYVVGKSDATDGWELTLNASRVPTITVYGGAGSVGSASGAALTLNTWGHVCATIDDGTQAIVYVDGVAGTPGALSGPITVSSTDFRIGSDTSVFYTGVMDQLVLWQKDIGSAGVAEVNNGGAGRFQ